MSDTRDVVLIVLAVAVLIIAGICVWWILGEGLLWASDQLDYGIDRELFRTLWLFTYGLWPIALIARAGNKD